MVVELIISVRIGHGFDSHADANNCDNNQCNHCVSLAVSLRYHIDSEDCSENFDKSHEHLVEVDVESKFIKTEQCAIIDEFN